MYVNTSNYLITITYTEYDKKLITIAQPLFHIIYFQYDLSARSYQVKLKR